MTNFTLKYVDASFYQVARGLVLPFTVATSFYFLGSRPSLRIILACAVVTAGFFVGVFLDGANVSLLGVFFGVASSASTAMHAVVIKNSLKTVNNSALDLSYYTNAVSAVLLIPVFILAGEGPGVMALFSGVDAAGKASPAYVSTFLSGSAITVSRYASLYSNLFHMTTLLGIHWLPYEHRSPPLHQSHLAHNAHDLCRRARCRCLLPRCLGLRRCNEQVGPPSPLQVPPLTISILAAASHPSPSFSEGHYGTPG